MMRGERKRSVRAASSGACPDRRARGGIPAGSFVAAIAGAVWRDIRRRLGWRAALCPSRAAGARLAAKFGVGVRSGRVGGAGGKLVPGKCSRGRGGRFAADASREIMARRPDRPGDAPGKQMFAMSARRLVGAGRAGEVPECRGRPRAGRLVSPDWSRFRLFRANCARADRPAYGQIAFCPGLPRVRRRGGFRTLPQLPSFRARRLPGDCVRRTTAAPSTEDRP